LRVWRGRLSTAGNRGEQVHAASSIRRRLVLLEAPLLGDPGELRRVLLHELFHFAWVRLGNPGRRSFEETLAAEFRQAARGELGWSAAKRKLALAPGDVSLRTRKWREYACESFCDTAAWRFAAAPHPERTLAARFRRRRELWFENRFPGRPVAL
jgi:hypothetical protein